MAILGIDFGAKKIGLAKADDEQKFALPLEILYNNGKAKVLAHLKNICLQHNIKKIVIGVPVSLHQGGKKAFWRQKDLQNKQMKEVLSFINWLKDNIDLPIEIEDERLTTKMANSLRKGLVKKGHDDAVAAMLILQSYLDKENL